METDRSLFNPRSSLTRAQAEVSSLRGRIVERAYQEAIELALTTRSYVRERQRRDLQDVAPATGLRLSGETLRVTARLAQVVAWLLSEKAVAAGELPLAALRRPEHRLGGGPAVTDPHIERAKEMPAELVELLERSWSIYDRVRRLDAAWRDEPADPA
jgi:regulator of CtrA degradation